MKLRDFYQEIESADFQSRFMIFSGFKLVRNALSRDTTIALLINEVRLNPRHIDTIGKRILYLYAEHRDGPGATFDIAVAAYLYCLYYTDQFFARRMSEYVLEMGKLWWSVDLALRIKGNMELFSDPGKSYINYYGDATPIENRTWKTHFESMRLKENVQFIVNGEELWNISGQLSVKSPQKTKTLVHSV